MAHVSDRWKPLPRDGALVVEKVEDETLVYDRETHAAHCLRADAARVFTLADGHRTVTEIARAAGLTAQDAGAIVGELVRADVLRMPRGMTRRTLARRAAGVLGAVTTIIVPEAAAAASCSALLQSCNGRPCCPGLICVLQPTLLRVCL